MQLSTRNLPFEMPNYSLTGDILSFQRCGLQYRYYSGSSLPPSRPVQIWTGEFIHGVMEEAYQFWDANKSTAPFPWPCTKTPYPRPTSIPPRLPYDLGVIGDTVEAKLYSQGKTSRSGDARDYAYMRIEAAMRILALHLFPLITYTEKKISGTRQLIPPSAAIISGQSPRCDRYELTGIADVISSVKLRQHNGNPIVEIIKEVIPNLSDEFDVIVDYKSSRRPNFTKDIWNHQNWQVQTYSWLRSQQPNTLPVGAGILIYLDELAPSITELNALKSDISRGETDYIPKSGSADYYALYRWQGGIPVPTFTQDFLLRRAIRVVNVSQSQINTAVSEIDKVVTEIEQSALTENVSGDILHTWPKTGDDNECVACDFRRFCPDTSSHRKNPGQANISEIPTAPG